MGSPYMVFMVPLPLSLQSSLASLPHSSLLLYQEFPCQLSLFSSIQTCTSGGESGHGFWKEPHISGIWCRNFLWIHPTTPWRLWILDYWKVQWPSPSIVTYLPSFFVPDFEQWSKLWVVFQPRHYTFFSHSLSFFKFLPSSISSYFLWKSGTSDSIFGAHCCSSPPLANLLSPVSVIGLEFDIFFSSYSLILMKIYLFFNF